LLLAGVVAVQQPADPGPRPAPAVPDPRDPRLYCIRQFFLTRDCPAHLYAEDFVAAADENGLDWRLLPSIAFVETGAGKTAQGNNLFGWDSGRAQFASVPHAIHWVAWRLASSSLYARKDRVELLRTYNPRPQYWRVVSSIMTRLAPD
jgi:hypothetical protein